MGGKTSEIKVAFAVLERLEAAERRLDKEALLRKHRDNSVLRKVMQLVLGNQKFYVHVEPNLTRCSAELSLLKAWAKFLSLLALLERRELVGDKAKNATTCLLLQTDAGLAKWLLRILDHNLRIGVSARTISSVWGKEFLYAEQVGGAERFVFRGCMLSKPRKDLPKKDAELVYPQGGEYKLDGERFLGYVWPKDRVVEIVSRGNKRAPDVEAVRPFMDQLLAVADELSPRGEPVFLDGEFLAKDWNKTASIIGRTKNFDPKHFLANMSAVLWDWTPLTDYQRGRWDAPWQQRKRELLGLVPAIDLKKIEPMPYQISPNVAILGHTILTSESDLERFCRDALDQEFEGAITKQLDGSYICDGHRSVLSVKHKPEETGTGIILKVRMGKKGKNARASDQQILRAVGVFKQWPRVTAQDDGYYLWTECPSAKSAAELGALLRQRTQDSSARRVLVNGKMVYYRYSARLHSLLIACGDTIVSVGGGYKEGKGTDPVLDQRMTLWRLRKRLVGRKIDFMYQKDPSKVANFRFNKFKRFRDDL